VSTSPLPLLQPAVTKAMDAAIVAATEVLLPATRARPREAAPENRCTVAFMARTVAQRRAQVQRWLNEA
jgi:hypothetical protein